MPRLSCPACGAPVEPRSAAPYAVCRHCQSLLVRNNVTLESIGRVAEVPQDLSPLQLYAAGVHNGRRFTLIGRVRKAWAQGSWSEWCALFDDQRLGWLAEAQGDFVMTFERPLTAFARPPSLESLRAGYAVMIEGRRFTVSDVKQVHCVGAEGELAACPPTGTAMTSIDLRGPGLEFGTLEATAREMRLFTGRFVEFADCRFSGLRALPGWTSKTPESR